MIAREISTVDIHLREGGTWRNQITKCVLILTVDREEL